MSPNTAAHPESPELAQLRNLIEQTDRDIVDLVKRRVELAANLDYVRQVLHDGAGKARTLARKVLDRAKQVSGLD